MINIHFETSKTHQPSSRVDRGRNVSAIGLAKGRRDEEWGEGKGGGGEGCKVIMDEIWSERNTWVSLKFKKSGGGGGNVPLYTYKTPQLKIQAYTGSKVFLFFKNSFIKGVVHEIRPIIRQYITIIIKQPSPSATRTPRPIRSRPWRRSV